MVCSKDSCSSRVKRDGLCIEHYSLMRADQEKEFSRIKSRWTDEELSLYRGIFLGTASRVYAIRSCEPFVAIKIGMSVNPEHRFSSIQTSCPLRLKLLGSVPGGEKLEKRLHRLLMKYHIRGEWFENKGMAKSIAEAIQDSNLGFIAEVIQ